MESKEKSSIDLNLEMKKEVRRFNNSVKYSIEGLISAYTNERSLILHLFMSGVIVVLGCVFKISVYDWILSLIMMGVILCIELLNTSIEACVDLITSKKHPLAKRSKDAASAASFMMSIFTLIGELTIFMPYFIEFFKNM